MYTGPTRSDVGDDDDELDNSTFYSGEDITLEDRDSFRKEENDEIMDDLDLGRMSEEIFDNMDLLCSEEIFMACGEEDELPQITKADVATERSRSTSSRHIAKESFVEIMLDAKEKDESEQNKTGMSSHRIIRSPSQDELRAIYESTSTTANTKPSLLSKVKSSNRTVSPFRKQKSSKLASPNAEPDWSNEIPAFTVSVTSADPKQGASTEMINRDEDTIEITSQCKRDALNLNNEKSRSPSSARSRSRLFTFKSKKDSKSIAESSVGTKQPSTGSKLPPASPARTAATGTSDSSIESRSSDDDTSLGDADLAITRTGSRILISI